MATIKKAQNGTAEYSDPSLLFKKIQKSKDSINNARKNLNNDFRLKALKFEETKKQNAINNSREDAKRAASSIEGYKGLTENEKVKRGITKLAPIKKKMKNGGSLSGLKASTKRVGPVDPKGAWTKVQERTIAGARGKAVLKKDKELDASRIERKQAGGGKMKMGGSVKKK